MPQIGALFLVIALIPICSIGQNRLPFPYWNMPDLTRQQRHKIDSIHRSCLAKYEDDYRRYKDSIFDINAWKKQPFMTQNDTARLRQSLQATEESSLFSLADTLLTLSQRARARQLISQRINQIVLVNFEKYKHKQQGSNLCWAACIQMMMNYNGIECTQQDVVQLLQGSVINEDASLQEMIANIGGFHPGFKDPLHHTWFLSTSEFPISGDMLVGMITPHIIFPGENALMIEGNGIRIPMIAVHGTHLCLIHKIRYRQESNLRSPVSITYYDPLLDKSVEMPWAEKGKTVTNWFYSVVAIEDIFPNR